MVDEQRDQDHQVRQILLTLLAMYLNIIKNQVLKVFMKFNILIDLKVAVMIKYRLQEYQQSEQKIKEVKKT